MTGARARRALAAAAAVLALALPRAAAAANPSLDEDVQSMMQWLSHELAQGLAFNAGSNFDPPSVVKGYALQPDVSFGVGRMPLDKRGFPALQTPALQGGAGSDLFPNTVLFPNLALHLRMGLPWDGDAYLRLADATTPAGYKISPNFTAQVQTNSYGAGLRQHFFGGSGRPRLTVGAHYNHVRGRTALKGKFNVNVGDNFTTDSDLSGDIRWSVNSFGLTAVAQQSFGAWTPFLGLGYNYATGLVSSRLDLTPASFLVTPVSGQASDRPEKSQGRWIFGAEYARPTWSVFANAELKALGSIQYRSFIAQVGFALPFEIGRGPAIFYLRRPRPHSPRPAPKPAPPAAVPPSASVPPAAAPRSAAHPHAPAPPPADATSSGLIFLQ
ncbi:MAG: hypothetical protein HY552_07305 [Elusimicrobia bacterium]|nr:hypothetical protein [Elusimicrobiota bacterium]